MALTLKNLCSRRQLTNASVAPEINLYPPPSTVAGSPDYYQPLPLLKSALIKNIILTNLDTGVSTIRVYYKPYNDNGSPPTLAANDVNVSPGILQIGIGQQVILNAELTLNLNNTTAANTAGWGPQQLRCDNVTGKVDVLINGIERDI
jgi:hypothetical protein